MLLIPFTEGLPHVWGILWGEHLGRMGVHAGRLPLSNRADISQCSRLKSSIRTNAQRLPASHQSTSNQSS